MSIESRHPSTSYVPGKDVPKTNAMMPYRNPVAYKGLFTLAREAFGEDIQGIVYATPDRVFFQKFGDPTPYSLALYGDERALFAFDPRTGK